MTIQNELGPEKKFVCCHLPWLVAAVALVIYLLTINSWVSVNNIGGVAKSAEWTPGATLSNPLYFLLTYPFRWLPVSWVPLAFNLFSAVCGVLTVALLARSVALLPQDRTENQRIRERGRFGLLSGRDNWIPPVLAAAVCGLQLTFWESATSGASQLLDLLLLAYVIRCLLEYRVTRRDSWLMRACVVFGAGMANGWILFCLLPLFVIAVGWSKKMEFFNPRFLIKASLFGMIGMLFYLVLPLIYVASADATASFWQALKYNLLSDRDHFTYLALRAPRNLVLPLLIASFLPLLVMSIRWASNFGDPSRMGSSLATWAFHLAHGALLAVCLWFALGPVVGPRHLAKTFPALTILEPLTPVLYYLGALGVGYLCGYFLVVFSPPLERTMRRNTVVEQWLQRISRVIVWVVLFLIPAGLLYRNLPQIQITNGPALKHYASLLVKNLPERGVVLSDDSVKLFLVQAQLASRGAATNYIFLDTQLLAYPSYHGLQQKLHPGVWIERVNPNGNEIVNPMALLGLMSTFAERMPVYYLHPSFGYYFELFYPEPHGLTRELKLYQTNYIGVAHPPFTEAQIAENEKFWSENKAQLDRLRPFVAEAAAGKKSKLEQLLLAKLHIPYEQNVTAVMVGTLYAQSLNFWGVEMQRAGRLPEAAKHFQTALALNAKNTAAKLNLELNRDLQASRKPVLKMPRTFEDEFGKTSRWDQVLRENGPYDDPTHCFGGGMTFSQSGLTRQSAQQFERVHELVPDNLAAQLWLSRLYLANRLPSKSLEMIASLRAARPDALADSGIQKMDLFGLQATALLMGSEPGVAEQFMQDAMREEPNNQSILAIVVQLSTLFGRLTNALVATERQLEISPDDATALRNKGVFNLQLQRFKEAVPPLTRLYESQTNNSQLQLLLGMACLGSDDVDTALKHYENLQRQFPDQPEINSGLAEIYWRKKDTNTSLKYYEMILSNAPPESPAFKLINERINSLKGQ